MKFSCQKDSILNEIANASGFSSSKSNLTITANVYLEAVGDRLTIKATDQKMGFSSEIAVNATEEGHLSVRCDKFLNVLRALPSEEIFFEEDNSQMLIANQSRSITFLLRTSKEDFPELMKAEESFFRLPKKVLRQLIEQTAFAVSTDESKYFMSGTLIAKEPDGIVMVGTDGKRLSYIKVPLEWEIPDFPKATIPLRFLNIIRDMGDSEGDYEISIDKDIIMLRTANREYYTVLINKQFPEYEKVIPRNQEHYCRVRIKDMDEALKRVSLLVDSKFKRLIFEIENDKILISSEESDIGTAKELIDCQFDGEPFRFGLNYTYLQAPIKVMEGEYFDFRFTNPSRAFVVAPEPDRGYLHVIMPMQVV